MWSELNDPSVWSKVYAPLRVIAMIVTVFLYLLSSFFRWTWNKSNISTRKNTRNRLPMPSREIVVVITKECCLRLSGDSKPHLSCFATKCELSFNIYQWTGLFCVHMLAILDKRFVEKSMFIHTKQRLDEYLIDLYDNYCFGWSIQPHWILSIPQEK